MIAANQSLNRNTTLTSPARRTRDLHVGYLPNQGRGSPKPQLKLAGKWLAEAGFHCGQAVSVLAEAGRLIITCDETAPSHLPPQQPPAKTGHSTPAVVLRFGRLLQRVPPASALPAIG